MLQNKKSVPKISNSLQRKIFCCAPMVFMMALNIFIMPFIGVLGFDYTDVLNIHFPRMYSTEIVMTFVETAFFVYVFLVAYANLFHDNSHVSPKQTFVQ